MKPPLAFPGQRIGLLGGSFDPPHQGHVNISREALKRLQLDQLWWLVSPGNPLKEQGPWPLERRLAQCRERVDHPRIKITAFETALGSPFTATTLHYLSRRFPATRFVWLMGADNMASVHLWRNWRQIFHKVPVAVIDRPGEHYALGSSLAAQLFAKNRLRERAAPLLAQRPLPAWCRLGVPLNFESSTGIRNRHRA
ncbi:MAG: nicotinate-nucleotide adenylyltransferase [Hyphomicrobiaceae bacterium]|nr:nicotinate-nucleotide adenylyltransferase [Hyphomicrobiaceae bacterium]